MSHAVVLTDALDTTLRFLGDVARVSPIGAATDGAPEDSSLVFGWPLDQAATIVEVNAGGVPFELIQLG